MKKREVFVGRSERMREEDDDEAASKRSAVHWSALSQAISTKQERQDIYTLKLVIGVWNSGFM